MSSLNGRLKDTSGRPFVVLEHAGKIYNGVTVLDEVSMSISEGEAMAVIGRNGSGKSTLLSILAGLIKVSSGRLHYQGKNSKIGYAPEVFPGLKFTPEEFLHSIGRLHGFNSGVIQSRTAALLERFHLGSYRSRSMSTYSKGMLQKVNLMQSVFAEPSLLLLDEPMSGLDAPAQDALVQLIKELKAKGTAVVFSVHEPHFVQLLADRVHVLHNGRTIRTLDRSELIGSSLSFIIYKGITKEITPNLSQMPGFISHSAADEYGETGCLALSVDSSVSDSFLRCILEAQGSIISVEQRGGMAGLELWMSPKPKQQEVAEA